MKIVDLWPVQSFRDKRAAEILEVLKKSGAIKVFRGENKIVIDLGSGQGEIPLAIAKEIGCFFVCVDKYSNPSERVKREGERKILWRREDAIEYLRNIGSDSAPAILASYFLQVLPHDKQVELLQEIRRVIRPGGKVLIIEEYKRGGLGQLVDVIMNKFLNAFNKQGYKIYSEEEWSIFFKKLGLHMPERYVKFGRNSMLFVFQF